MKNLSVYKKEKIALIIQLGIFWLIPLIMLRSGPIFMVLFMLWATFILSLWLCCASQNRVKYLLPIAAAVLFAPTVPVFYNNSAWAHVLWYFVVSCAGFVTGMIVNLIIKGIRKIMQLSKILNV